MKVKAGLISHKIGEQYVTVASGDAGNAFNGMMRSNDTAAQILQMLEHEISEEQIVDQLYTLYDAPREVIAADVHQIIEQIRSAGLLDE